ncbi:MAG: MBOAT family protein [Leptospiraceae bacterium]|nr:MBOAT family protein [Leptospiraceae bacterium]
MLFVTQEFLIFFLVVALVYWLIPANWRMMWLIASSVFFYATWNFVFTFHLFFVVGINYVVMEIYKIHRKKWIFITLQIANVANIGVFKYYYLVMDFLGVVLGADWLRESSLRMQDRLDGHEILLPLAISFYTFQIMSYGIDIYRGQYTKQHTFREVFLFKSFFPQLIAGPIMRSSELLPQIQKMDEFNPPSSQQTERALWLIISGIVKKMLIADQMTGALIPFLTGNPADFPSHLVWIYTLGCVAMLYADFSAYTDLARGTGLLLGFEIPLNFKAPLFMHSVSEFWRRWHLTFSRWIRDYIYIPLGGSHVPEYRNYINLVITFFIGGLWHGASYTFVLWGILTGLILSAESFAFRRGWKEWPDALPGRILRVALTYLIFLPSTVFFFGKGMSWCGAAVVQMFSFDFSGPVPAGFNILGYGILGVFFFHLVDEWPERFAALRKYDRWLLPAGGFALILAMTQFAGPGKDFFYFQF